MAWAKIESEGTWVGEKHRATFLIDTAGDISDPPDENSQLAPGSIAYTADLKSIYQKDRSGNWQQIGG